MTPASTSNTGPIILWLAAVTLLLAWMVLPSISQDQSYHHFADQHRWLGVPHATDVLSNFAFALVGLVGVVRLASSTGPRFSSATEASMWSIAVGLVFTSLGSAWYHFEPTDSSLFWDRLPMTVVFAGVVAGAAAQRIGSDVGRVGLAVLIPLGIVSVVHWRITGDLSPYVTLQLGGFGATFVASATDAKGG